MPSAPVTTTDALGPDWAVGDAAKHAAFAGDAAARVKLVAAMIKRIRLRIFMVPPQFNPALFTGWG